jgi:hypothetical protein
MTNDELEIEQRNNDLRKYMETGDINIFVSMYAALAQVYFESICKSMFIKEVARFYEENKEILGEISNKNIKITNKAAEWGKINSANINRLIDIYKYSIEADGGEFKVRALGTCGRILVTISGEPNTQYNGAMITLVFEDGNPTNIGIQGICSTYEEAMRLLDNPLPTFERKKLYFI